MNLKTIKRFYDLEEKKLRLPDDVFVVNKERGEQLLSLFLVQLVKEGKGKTKKKSGE